MHELKGLGVAAFAYTSENVTEFRKSGQDLAAAVAACRWSIVCIDPEHLINKEWERIIDDAYFRDNFGFGGVDEVHTLDEWGNEFRPSFLRVGPWLRGCAPKWISIFGLTATLQAGRPTSNVCKLLGFLPGMFHLYRRSNERRNVQLVLKPLAHSIGGDTFPDLLPYLNENRKTVIYCATIELSWRVYIFLLRLLPAGPRRQRRIRLYNSLCWPAENEKTVDMVRDDPMCQVIVATVAFGMGFNVKSLLDSIQIGVAKSIAQIIQQAGRVARDPATTGRAIIFAQPSAYKNAKEFLANGGTYFAHSTFLINHINSGKGVTSKSSRAQGGMDNDRALLLTCTGCLNVFFNHLFGNTNAGADLDCIAVPRELPCSNCLPQFTGQLVFSPSSNPPGPERLRPLRELNVLPMAPQDHNIPKLPKLTRKMRAAADTELRQMRGRIQKAERVHDIYGCAPASSYLSDPTITTLLDNLFVIATLDSLKTLIPKWAHHQHHGVALAGLMTRMRVEFLEELNDKRLESNARRNEREKLKRVAATVVSSAPADASEGEPIDADVASLVVPESPDLSTRRVTRSIRPRSDSVLADTSNLVKRPRRAPAAPRAPQKSMQATMAAMGPAYMSTSRSRTRRGRENS